MCVRKGDRNELSYGKSDMKHIINIVYIVVITSSTLLSQPTVQAQSADPGRGHVSGHVWLDSDCNGIKDADEGSVANTGIVQFIGTGDDRILNPGDHAITIYTDTEGNWTATDQRVYGIDDGLSLLYAVAVGEGTAAALRYKVSPEGGDSILTGPTHASPTFELVDGGTRMLGEIGVCPLLAGQKFKIYLPSMQH